MIQFTQPMTRRWTLDEFYQMGELGMFVGQQVELIEGEVLQMSPQGSVHYACVWLVAEALRDALGQGYWVRTQAPLELGADTDPEPDVAVVEGTARDYVEHPKSALLVVEIGVTSLDHDHNRKASLYAQAGLADYWVLDPNQRELTILRDPKQDATQFYGFGYASRLILAETEVVAPLAAPQSNIPVASMLPPR